MAQSNGRTTTELTEYEQQYSVPKGSFDKERCTDEQIREIADRIDNWEDLAPFLELTKTDIQAIRNDHAANDKLQRRAALNKWKQKKGFKATYAALLKALLKSERKDLACEVCELVVPHLKGISLYYVILNTWALQFYFYFTSIL